MHSARKVANFFLDRAEEQGEGLSPMKVIKLVYIAHGFMLANRSRELIADIVEAWEYGPVVADLYHALKRYGNDPIPIRLEEQIAEYDFDEDERAVMEKVFDHYGKFTGGQLSGMTHQEETPWDEVRNKFGKNAIIPDEMTRKHYAKKLAATKKND